MSVLEQCKVVVRTTTSDEGLLAHIGQLIDAAKRDLSLGGVHESWLGDEPDDPLVVGAVKAYVGWQYFFDDDTYVSEKWLKSYNIHLSKIHNRSVYSEPKAEAI